MVNTWSISNNDGWSIVAFCLRNSLYTLVVISTHSDLSYINITIANRNSCQIFLLNIFTTCCELSDSTDWCSLRSLSTCIGVNFCIEYHYINILSRSQYMVNTAVTDIECPSVTTEDPLGLLS